MNGREKLDEIEKTFPDLIYKSGDSYIDFPSCWNAFSPETKHSYYFNLCEDVEDIKKGIKAVVYRPADIQATPDLLEKEFPQLKIELCKNATFGDAPIYEITNTETKQTVYMVINGTMEAEKKAINKVFNSLGEITQVGEGDGLLNH